MWVLQTIVPERYRVPEAIGPSRPAEKAEDDTAAAYVGLYTMVMALIIIAGGRLPENKLDRSLRRMNANQSTPVDTTDKTIALMIKDGYIVRVKETVNGDDTIDYIVGPRGKVEMGREGFAELVRRIYGDDEDEEELEKKIKRTLDVAGATSGVTPAGEAPTPHAAAGRKRGRPRRGVDEDEDDDE
jgi:hypothetical protein